MKSRRHPWTAAGDRSSGRQWMPAKSGVIPPPATPSKGRRTPPLRTPPTFALRAHSGGVRPLRLKKTERPSELTQRQISSRSGTGLGEALSFSAADREGAVAPGRQWGRPSPGVRGLCMYAGRARTLGGESPPWRRWHQSQAKGNCVAARRGGKEAGGETATRGTRTASEAGRPGRACMTRRSPLPSSGRHVNAAAARGRCPGLSRETCRRTRVSKFDDRPVANSSATSVFRDQMVDQG